MRDRQKGESDILTKNLVLAGLFTALTAIGAFIKIPFPLVPLTLQTLFTVLSGVLLLPEYAALSQVAYLILGLAGLPVFANGGGIGYVLQPTFGYLLSLPLAAFVVARLRMHGRNSLSLSGLFGSALFGLVLVLTFGDVWLYFALKFGMGKTVSLFHIILVGAVVFLPGALLKAFLAAFVGRSIQRRFNT
ncbi:MAG: biotin transporter BioY [Actinobacteria bacterium]|nr:biotin transporter BioY [Actinomycetota bacterium]